MKKFSLIFFIFSLTAQAQELISLEECYELAAENYPLVQQKALLEDQLETEKQVVRAEQLPQLRLFSQASYQSDIIDLPLPNASLLGPNKDQYRNELHINQLIYGSGLIDAKSEVLQKTNQTQQLALDVRLFQLKQNINQLYFSILLHQEKLELQVKRNQQLQQQLSQTKL